MNIYLISTIAAIVIFTIVGIFAGRKVKDTNDYYVAGRKAPVILIVGSLIASFLSTGAFMGDTGEVYSGFFMGIVIVGIFQALGYIYGATLFGKYIRRSKANTVPEYFGIRFNSTRIRKLAAITLIFGVTAYLLSAIQGASTLMASITELDYKWCVIIAWISFTIFTVYSGSKGVLLTDTIMFIIFLIASLIGIPYIINAAGGWFSTIEELANSTTNPGMISWTNNLKYLYPSGALNLIWAIVYGIVWAVVVMVSPWQTSRYLMAKNEHTVVKSSIWASIGVTVVTMSLYFSAAFVYKINPNLDDSSTTLIWAAMNVMPTTIGVIMLTGILSAGISSASTFLSLIGSSLTNDILSKTKKRSEKEKLKLSRIGMAIVSLIALLLAFFNPPHIFWIMYFGGTVIASSWGIVAIASVWSKRLSENGAFYGMLLGFIGCVIPKGISTIAKITLPLYFDPFIIGLICSVIGMVIGSKIKPITKNEISNYKKLHVIPKIEINYEEDKKTHKLTYLYISFGLFLSLFFIFFYALPYMNAIK